MHCFANASHFCNENKYRWKKKRLMGGEFQHEDQKEDIEAEGFKGVADKMQVIVGIRHFKALGARGGLCKAGTFVPKTWLPASEEVRNPLKLVVLLLRTNPTPNLLRTMLTVFVPFLAEFPTLAFRWAH